MGTLLPPPGLSPPDGPLPPPAPPDGSTPGVARGRLEPPPVATPSAAAGLAASANHAAAKTDSPSTTIWRHGQRIEAVSSTLSPLAGWSLAKPARFGAGAAIVQP